MAFDLLVAFCSHRVISAPTCNSLEKLRIAELKGELGFTWSQALFTGDALISRARSQACSKFLDDTIISYMLFIDDDIVFEPQHVVRIYNHLKSGYDVIGGIYPVRGATQLSSYGWGGKVDIDGEVHNIEYLATGFMGISRRILLKMREDLKLPLLNPNDWSRCYPFFECGRKTDRKNADPIYISEDWEFCDKVRKIGGQIFADTSVQLGHIREHIFTPDDVRKLQNQSRMENEIYGAMIKHEKLSCKLDEDLSEFFSYPLEKTRNRIENAQKRLAERWKIRKGTVEEFYHNNEWYVFDLTFFNVQPMYYQNVISGIVNIRGQKILDIGCGIGTAVFILADQGNDVLGWDINKKCTEFANFKKKKYNLGGEFTTEKPDYSQFDLIIAVDTLEHIEDLRGFLMQLGKEMKQGAKLYHSEYWPKEDSWPMHFEENQEHLSQWLKEAGFIEWDGRWCVRG